MTHERGRTDDPLEIERRFLARVEPAALERADHVESLEQGYLSDGEVTVRVRRHAPRDGTTTWILTLKQGSGRVRHEVEVELDEPRGRQLMTMAGDRRVRKTRHHLGRWEVDRFEGRYDGLVVAEIELEREDEALPAAPAGLSLGEEVTDTLSSAMLAALDAAGADRLLRRLGIV